MRSSIRRIGLALLVISSLFAWSCEKHHVGELPREKHGADAEHAAAEASPASPTPAEFFPNSTPP